MSTTTSDIIDKLAGIAPGTHLHGIRDQRPQARENAQKSYLALFEPEFPGNVSAIERYAIATFVAGLHRQPAVMDFYASGLKNSGDADITETVSAEIARGSTEGPYGHYPPGPLSAEDQDGLDYHVSVTSKGVLGRRIAAALEHAHLLVFRPRDASAAALQKLLDAGWSTTDIVTLSQLVAFLSFQVRVIAGLRTLAAAHEQAAVEIERASIFTTVLASGGI
ncbi:CMD domain protein [Microvirga puerhi]|uniref:CMD domain protein n=1 Tax=Microvirga puerhi TaxID=2876078 RepID=A0ABS7VIN0_9HYPH|nr:CMD domain protein [Microvirga puerhi]MBZ6075347.1 CMD domain protein [Microvirga puerhi]